MDAFFASIEQRDNPSFRGKPVIVGADPQNGKGRGVVSTCSYEARAFGIHSAMPISIAYRKCPHGIFVRPNIKKYTEMSDIIYDILYTFTPDIEMISIDEAFLDISGTYHLFGTPQNVCIKLKSDIFKKTSLTCSVGLGPSKMVAKIASEINKPDGLVVVSKDKVCDFLWPLSIKYISGIGEKTLNKLYLSNIKTIGDISKLNVEEASFYFGSLGEYYLKLSHGIDNNEITVNEQIKSISNEITFEKDTDDISIIESTLTLLSEKVSNRLRQQRLKGLTITLKVRLYNFKTYTRSFTLKNPTNSFEDIHNISSNLFKFNNKIRLLGVKVSNFKSKNMQTDLFDNNLFIKRDKIDNALDKIHKRYGFDSIHHARKHL